MLFMLFDYGIKGNTLILVFDEYAKNLQFFRSTTGGSSGAIVIASSIQSTTHGTAFAFAIFAIRVDQTIGSIATTDAPY